MKLLVWKWFLPKCPAPFMNGRRNLSCAGIGRALWWWLSWGGLGGGPLAPLFRIGFLGFFFSSPFSAGAWSVACSLPSCSLGLVLVFFFFCRRCFLVSPWAFPFAWFVVLGVCPKVFGGHLWMSCWCICPI